jgi:hypothetical protein
MEDVIKSSSWPALRWFTSCTSCQVLNSQRTPLMTLSFQISKEIHSGVSSWVTARLGISRSCVQKCDYVPSPLSTSLLLLIKLEFLKSTKFSKLFSKLRCATVVRLQFKSSIECTRINDALLSEATVANMYHVHFHRLHSLCLNEE